VRRPRVAVVALGVLLAACVGRPSTAPSPSPSSYDDAAGVRVGSFDFAEGRLLGELYAQALERHGVAVERLPPLASREIMEPAMVGGLVDLVPEYVGTLLTFLAGTPPDVGLEDALARLRDELAPHGVRVLAAAPAQNSNGVAVTRDLARRLGLRTISDLGPVASRLRFGGPTECPERPLCLRGLHDRYGLSFASFTALDASGPLTLAAILGAEVDVATVFTTSGVASHDQLVLLQDDLGLQPAENIVPVVRASVAARMGERLLAPVDAVSRELTTPALAEMVAIVESGRGAPADVAAAWLDRHAL
jgi:osmoprotectant transport system substrate-binding protein